MSTADADKIDAEVAARDKSAAKMKADVKSETDAKKKEAKQNDLDDFEAVSDGMRRAAKALRENPNAKHGAVIPRLIAVEREDVKKLEAQRKAAQAQHDAKAVARLDRQIELANLTIDGKSKADALLALARGAGGQGGGKLAMKISIEDDLGRELVQLTVNLFPSS